mgnify:FL=1
MLRKKWIHILLILFCLWLITSAYYYNQHRITIKRCAINEKVTLNGVVIQLDEIVFTDKERNYGHYNIRLYQTIGKLPLAAQTAFVKVKSFYSKPYKKIEYNDDNQFGIIELRGTSITDKELDLDYLDRISMLNETGANYYEKGKGIEKNKSNHYFFYICSNHFNINDKELVITIKDENDDIIKSIPIKLDWQNETYNYFNRPPNTRPTSIR